MRLNKAVEYRSLSCLGFPDYRVGSDGSVWRFWKGPKNVYRRYKKLGWVKLKVTVSKQGRPYLMLCNDGVKKTYMIQILVLSAFVGLRPKGMQCCHNDGDVKNNRVENLRWDTAKGNAADRKKHGTEDAILKWAERGFCKFSPAVIRRLMKLWKSGKYTQAGLARAFDISPSWVSRIVRGEFRTRG